jgi:ribosomal protein S27AE
MAELRTIEKTNERPCPDCGGTLTRAEAWEPWTCGGCYGEYEECSRCASFTPPARYGEGGHRGIEDCIGAIGSRLAAIEARAPRPASPSSDTEAGR